MLAHQLFDSVVKAELGCVMSVKKECSVFGYEVFEVTAALYASVTVKRCLAQQIPPTCGLHSVAYLGRFISSADHSKEDVCRYYLFYLNVVCFFVFFNKSYVRSAQRRLPRPLHQLCGSQQGGRLQVLSF